MNGMAGKGSRKGGGRPGWVRDAVLLAAFAGVIAWSLFFTVVQPGAGPSGAAPAAADTGYRGKLTMRAYRLPEDAWGVVRAGDRMGDSARVVRAEVRDFGRGRRELHVTLSITGPIQFTTETYPFPQRKMPLRIGSVVWLENERYTLVGDVIAMNP